MALVDINADGALDLLAANSNNAAAQHNYFYLNSGSGSLRDGVNMELIAGPTGDSVGIATGDLNGDGYLDAVVRNGLSTGTSSQADVVYLWDDTAHAFNPVTTLTKSAAQSRGDIALGDFDGDGDLDIVRVFGTTIANEIFWNNGNGTFNATPSALPATTGTSYTCATGDFNGDGYVDIFVGKSGAGENHYVYFNDGTGTFTSGNAKALPAANNGLASDCAVGDVDRDGDLDIVVSRGTTGNGYGNYFYKNNGNTSGYTNWAAASAISGDTRQSLGICLADVDRDGDLDAITANYNQRVRLYLFDSGQFQNGSNISSGNLNALSCTTGDVDGDGDLDLVVGINTARNQIFYNMGFNAGTTTPWHQAEPAKVSILVNPVVNWSFENASPYSNWAMNETYETPTPPAYILPEYGTFGIVTNQPGGTTIHFGDVIHDYYLSGNDQEQFSLNLVTAIPGVPGVTVQGSESAHTAVILSGGLRDATLTQTFTIARDQYLKGLELQFDLSYWNPNLYQPDGQEFTATQFVEVYLYDTTSGSPTPIWHTANGVDSSVVGTMKHYSLKLGATDPLVSKIASTGAQLGVKLHVSGMDWYLDAAIDDVKLVPTRKGWALGTASPQPPELLMATADTGSGSAAEASVLTSAMAYDTLSASQTGADSSLSILTSTRGASDLSLLSVLDSASSGGTSVATGSGTIVSGASFSGGMAIDVTGTDSYAPSAIDANPTPADQSVVALSNDSDVTGSDAVASAPGSSDILLANDPPSVQASVTGEGVPTKNFDLRTAFAFDLASVSAFDVLDTSIGTGTPLPGMETRDLLAKIQSGASAAVSMDAIRLTDFLI